MISDSNHSEMTVAVGGKIIIIFLKKVQIYLEIQNKVIIFVM